jgi:hypothetical protein
MNCASGPVHGLIFTYNDYAGEMNADRTIPASIQSIGCQYSVLGLMSFGNSGAGQIAYDKGIKRISSIDYSVLSILTIFFNRNCTIVTGATY